MILYLFVYLNVKFINNKNTRPQDVSPQIFFFTSIEMITVHLNADANILNAFVFNHSYKCSP